MLKQTLVVLLNVGCHFHCVNRCTATFLFDVCTEPQGLRSTAGVLTFIASVLELRLLGMVSTMKEFTSYEV